MAYKIKGVQFEFDPFDKKILTAEEKAVKMVEEINQKVTELKLENQKLREKFNFKGSL